MSQNTSNDCYVNKNMKGLYFNLNQSTQVCKIMIRNDTRLMINDPIFTMIDFNSQRQSFLSPISGIITKLYIHESDILSYGSIILEYEECRHTITFKNLCGDCGIDLNQLKHVSTPFNSPKPNISMLHSIPDVMITKDEGLKYDYEEQNYLLQKRKLHLLVDLDQTLVHTTNSKYYFPYSPDIISFQLNPVSPTLHTKLRPGVKTFLTNLLSFYQFHLITFGDRSYAHTIAKLIDPNKIFFSDRILSRDECLSLTDKTANLTSLFPSGDSLVCIIDDREDVWNYSPNLVHVKPYMWFRDVGDINDIYLPQINQKHKYSDEKIIDDNSEQISTINSSNFIQDTDNYLSQLEIILKRIHSEFYKTYDKWNENKQESMPNLKQIIPTIRQQVLSSVSLCFSHLMPQDYPLEKHRATKVARAMGAKVTDDLEFDNNDIIQTTHVVAGKQTYKVYQAQKNQIKVVTPEWLLDCYEHWEKKAEENYILNSNYKVRKSRLFTNDLPRLTTKRSHSDIHDDESTIVQLLSNQQINPTIINQEQLNIENKVTDLSINDNEQCDHRSRRPKKQRRTMLTMEVVKEKKNDHDNEDSDVDSSYTQKLQNFLLNKEDDFGSDEEQLDDDEVPHGWKEDRKEKK